MKPFHANGICENIEAGEICRVKLEFSNGLGSIPRGIINDPAQFSLTTVNFMEGGDSYDVDVCFSANQYLSASNADVCPTGSLAKFQVSNETANNNVLKSMKKVARDEGNSLKNRFSNRFSQKSLEQIFADNEADTDLYLVPGTDYVIVSFKNLDKATNLTVHLEGKYCPGNGEVWDGITTNDNCVAEPADNSLPTAAKIEADTTTLYRYDATGLTGSNQLSFNFTANAAAGDDVDVYVSNTFYPTKEFNLASIQQNEAEVFYCEGNCGHFYFTVVNSGTTDYDVTITQDSTPCPDGFFGNACAFNTTGTVPVVTQVNTTGVVGKLERGFAYYELDFTDVATESYVRVSTGPVDDDDAPGLYLRQGNRPSLTQYQEMLDSGSATNQIQIEYVAGQNWYAMVVATEDDSEADDDDAFVIWAGPNCLDNCKGAGQCLCNGANCTATNQFELSTTVDDSYAVCNCEDEEADFQCLSTGSSSSSSGFWTTTTIVIVVIIVILIVCLIIGGVAGGLYWYKTKKRGEYESV